MKLGENVIAKIPTTVAGLEAIKYLAAKNIPIIATEIMSLAQVVSVCETYKKATQKLTDKPALYVTHITGIFDEYLKGKVEELGISIPQEILAEAGLLVARKQYTLMKERNYDGIMLGGGARELKHFTGLVGGGVDITINWKSTAEDLMNLSPELEDKLNTPINKEYVKILENLLPDFKHAYEPDALEPDKYESYGPVVLFRNAFIKGWKQTLEVIEAL
jgi:transaldolase